MSASEKLMVLQSFNAPPSRGQPMPMYAVDALFHALPQIVAVIESAEREVGMEDDTEEARMRSVPRLRAALTALEEVLS